MKEIKELSMVEKKSFEQMGLKLSEEVGEVSQALLSYLQASGSEYKELNAEDVKEECVDVILVALSLFYKLGAEETDLNELMNKKVNKWKEKTNK
jgi:NTP pyrophosphatase (non-canonical NTP hydrolase)